MFEYVIGAMIGAFFMGKTKPITKIQTRKSFGARTGTWYDIDILPGGDIIIVHGPDRTQVVFRRAPGGHYEVLQGLSGSKTTLELMQRDFSP